MYPCPLEDSQCLLSRPSGQTLGRGLKCRDHTETRRYSEKTNFILAHESGTQGKGKRKQNTKHEKRREGINLTSEFAQTKIITQSFTLRGLRN